MKRYAKGGIYRAEMGEPPSPDEGPTEVKTSRVVQKKDTAKTTPKTDARSSGQIFKADMLQKFGGSMKEPPTDPEGVPKKYAKGGYVKAADGCVQRGKTKGRVI